MSYQGLNVVTFLWNKPGYRTAYTPEHVNTLYHMIARHYVGPFVFWCFTDQLPTTWRQYHKNINVGDLWSDHADVPSPHGGHNPSCYRRLKIYSEWARQNIGPRIVSIDLDMIVTGSLNPLWDRPEDFVYWEDALNKYNPINGAMQLITPGLRDDIWSAFDPRRSPGEAKKAGYWGSDQAWIGYQMRATPYGKWTQADGAVSWRLHCKRDRGGHLPPNARIVNFHGDESPWDVKNAPAWIAEHYR